MRQVGLLAIIFAAAFTGGLLVVGPLASSLSAGDDTLQRYQQSGCFLSFEEGRFEMGGPSGSRLIVMGDGVVGGDPAVPDTERAIPLSWPDSVAVRHSPFSAEIVSGHGEVLARSGQGAHIGGGYGGDDTFWACGNSAGTLPMP